jgi:hypothetical protein
MVARNDSTLLNLANRRKYYGAIDFLKPDFDATEA